MRHDVPLGRGGGGSLAETISALHFEMIIYGFITFSENSLLYRKLNTVVLSISYKICGV